MDFLLERSKTMIVQSDLKYYQAGISAWMKIWMTSTKLTKIKQMYVHLLPLTAWNMLWLTERKRISQLAWLASRFTKRFSNNEFFVVLQTKLDKAEHFRALASRYKWAQGTIGKTVKGKFRLSPLLYLPDRKRPLQFHVALWTVSRSCYQSMMRTRLFQH